MLHRSFAFYSWSKLNSWNNGAILYPFHKARKIPPIIKKAERHENTCQKIKLTYPTQKLRYSQENRRNRVRNTQSSSTATPAASKSGKQRIVCCFSCARKKSHAPSTPSVLTSARVQRLWLAFVFLERFTSDAFSLAVKYWGYRKYKRKAAAMQSTPGSARINKPESISASWKAGKLNIAKATNTQDRVQTP